MQLPYPPAAIIFDLDGTLVNTEPLHCQAWLYILAARGFHYDAHWFEQWIGTSDRFLALGVIKEHGLSIEPRELQREKEQLFHARVREQAELYPEVATTLSYLQGRLPLAIATNSSREDAIHVFAKTKLDTYMDTTVTASDVTQLKPAPDMYLLAAEKLGVAPASCLVVEDSPAGATAARAAGMYVLGLTSSQPREKMNAAHTWFENPTIAMRYLRELVGSSFGK
ncbi:MAG: HAD family phosphatase [Bacteroidetes bacterium]|nr:MAG: HAD family phosphatase [Bacteroidota bacterium]